MCSLSVYLSQNKMVCVLSFGLISCIEENLIVLIAFYSLEYSCVFFKCLFESKQNGLCLSFGLISCIEENLTVLIAFYSLNDLNEHFRSIASKV